MRRVWAVALAGAVGLVSSPVQAATITWDFGHFTDSGSFEINRSVSQMTFTQPTAQGDKTLTVSGLLLMTVDGYAPGLHNLFQKDYRKTGGDSDEEGMGLMDVNDHEISLHAPSYAGDPLQGLPNSAIEVDVSSILGFTNAQVSAGSVQTATGDYWDLWGSNLDGLAGYNDAVAHPATQLLLTDRSEDWGAAVPIPDWGEYKYLFMTVTPNVAQSSTANVLFGYIQADDVGVGGAPEPASLALLALGAVGLLARRRLQLT